VKTAHAIPRIGLARATNEHLAAANDQPKPTPPAQLQRLKDKGWKYTRSEATDIRKTFARAKREQQKGRK
jgi:hypothetical protein